MDGALALRTLMRIDVCITDEAYRHNIQRHFKARPRVQGGPATVLSAPSEVEQACQLVILKPSRVMQGWCKHSTNRGI